MPKFATCHTCMKPIDYRNRRCLDCIREAAATRSLPRVAWCRWCGDQIPAERNANSIYCSTLCKTRSVSARRVDVPRRPSRRSPEAEQRHAVARRAVVAGARIDRQAIYERDRWCCGLCGERVDPALKWPERMSASLDHVIPLAAGGPHTPENLQLAHLRCNAKKGARGGNEQVLLIG